MSMSSMINESETGEVNSSRTYNWQKGPWTDQFRIKFSNRSDFKHPDLMTVNCLAYFKTTSRLIII